MLKNGVEVVISTILLTTTGLLFLINRYVSVSRAFADPKSEYDWIVSGLRNVSGYSTVFLPGYLIYRYIGKVNYFNKAGHNGLAFVLRKCFESDETIECANAVPTKGPQSRTFLQDGLLLLFYFVGLQASFLTWGVLQEKVMTQEYTNAKGRATAHFTDSQFLVFVNRILAFLLSGVVVLCTRQPTHRAPLYKYVYCSLSNILSSWCQYEALKYVSFPYQVLAKATKTIPVMILGKVISKTKYESYEYLTALLLSVGMLFFMLDTGNDHKGSNATTLSGVFLLCSYIGFDSFTSNWQGALFKQYHMKPIQMMCGVNLFSCIFTAISLTQQGGFLKSANFMLDYPAFAFDCLLLSLCSATGQLFIFKTIATFGPLIFVIITTIRQGFSVLLSCVIYKHEVHAVGIVGVLVVFFSIFLRIYCGHRIRTKRKRAQNAELKI